MRGRVPVRKRAMGMGQGAGARKRPAVILTIAVMLARRRRLALVAGAPGQRARCRPAPATCRWCRRSSAAIAPRPCWLLGQLEREHAEVRRTPTRRACSPRACTSTATKLDKAAAELAAVAEHSQDQELALVARAAPGARADRTGQARRRARDARAAPTAGAFAGALPRGARRCLLRQGRQGGRAERVSQRQGRQQRRAARRCWI